ncbi:hypothetical protein HPB50_018784 [Hyalomma asiaticum]|uniref:Uncharacterized protein n=1 Tax=Hyalomma asiaticum TaxID=266040 RepID=A0ACB7RMV0_HYAAI|nr:hypothetical protein HPB50_018784 [Hyalomma asiaticum]
MPPLRKGFLTVFKEHPIVGINWRTTWLVEEPAVTRLCSVCRIIPKKTVKLPCGHFFCASCHDSCSLGGAGKCPMDLTPFKDAQCTSLNFPPKKSKRLRVYCWNEPKGCQFIGTLEELLPHFEGQCGFHTGVCERCRRHILQTDFVTHLRAGCGSRVFPALAKNRDSHKKDDTSKGLDLAKGCADTPACSISDDSVLSDTQTSSSGTDIEQNCDEAVAGCTSNLPATRTSRNGWNVAQEDENTFTINISHDSVLAAIQTQMDELGKHLSSQQAMLADITRELRAREQTLREDMTDIVRGAISSSLPQRLSSGKSADEDATPSTSTSPREDTLILRKLEHFADTTLGTLEQLRQNMPQSDRRVTARCEPADKFCHWARVQSVSDRSAEGGPYDVSYFLTLENAAQFFLTDEGHHMFAEVTVWHVRGTYFVVYVKRSFVNAAPVFALEIEFNALLESVQCLPTRLSVKALDVDDRRMYLHESCENRCTCRRALDAPPHFHKRFFRELASLSQGVHRNGSMVFQIDVVAELNTMQ